jgi:hypothetical protein
MPKQERPVGRNRRWHTWYLASCLQALACLFKRSTLHKFASKPNGRRCNQHNDPLRYRQSTANSYPHTFYNRRTFLGPPHECDECARRSVVDDCGRAPRDWRDDSLGIVREALKNRKLDDSRRVLIHDRLTTKAVQQAARSSGMMTRKGRIVLRSRRND